ncbi:uncharacterized protein LOC118463473 [Anopheles albimanus]|uniref:uncharacterized protein LOC118463473 n=1 Tax=Anopheles albimanus TaxID=7167 RepID=UPI0016422235|nr:uncharacterized protein LOC118463473 [Anopheles albimanus]
MRAAILVIVLAAVVAAKTTSVSKGLATSRALSRACNERQTCKDCSTVNICGYDKTVLAEYRCADQDPEKKYCRGAGECSEEPDVDNQCFSADDRCPLLSSGYYPDPQNCTRYLYCDSSAIGYEEYCLAANNVYNQTSASCFLKKKSSDCFQVDCSSSKNKDKWFIYTPFPQIYFLCSADGRAVTFKCPKENEVFDVNLKKCRFQCTSDGRFADPNNDSLYYECLYTSSTKLELFEKECPPFTKFDEQNKRCQESQ